MAPARALHRRAECRWILRPGGCRWGARRTSETTERPVGRRTAEKYCGSREGARTKPLNNGSYFRMTHNRAACPTAQRMRGALHPPVRRNTGLSGVSRDRFAALEIMQAAASSGNAFDVAFADMVMPEMDGWRLGAEIHNNPVINGTKLYLMIPEGSLGADAKMKLLEWFNGYLYKPLKRRIVFNLLNDIYRTFFAASESESITEVEPIETPEHKRAAAEPVLQSNAPQYGFSGVRILAVDDHPVNKQLLQIMLEKAGCTVTTASDGQEAVNEALKTEFDIIFMDIQMPILNGYEAAQFLREKGYKKPIIACTAGSQEDEKKLCLSMGMNDIITKPFNKTRLFDVIKKYSQKPT